MSYIGSEEISKIREGTGYIQRLYLGSELVFKYTNSVTYHIDDSTGITKVLRDVEYGTSCRTAYTADTPSGWGSEWKFVGWSTEKTANGTVLSSSNDKIMGHEAVDLYAVFEKVFTLSYAAGGGTGSMDAQTITQYYNNGSYSVGDANGVTFTLKAHEFERTDYTFNGWSIGELTKKEGDPITLSGDATATALWKVTFQTISSRDYRGDTFDIHGYGNGVAPNHWWDTDNSYENGEPVESDHGDVFNGYIEGSSDPADNLKNFTKVNLTGSKSITLSINDFHSAESMMNANSKGAFARIYFDNVLVLEANTKHIHEGWCEACEDITEEELKKKHLQYTKTVDGETYQKVLNQLKDKTKVTVQHCHYNMDGNCEAAQCDLKIE